MGPASYGGGAGAVEAAAGAVDDVVVEVGVGVAVEAGGAGVADDASAAPPVPFPHATSAQIPTPRNALHPLFIVAPMTPTKVAILGTGDVGRALGSGFVSRGHEVKMGSRDAANEKAVKWAKEAGTRASVGTFADAAKFGEIVVIATLWAGTKSAIDLAGPDAFAGKVVIDATNPLDFSRGMPPRLALGHSDSGGEQVQRWLPKARVVKCFNIVGNAHMVDPKFPGGPPDMWIAGNDDGAKRTVGEVLRDFGWPPPIDLGGIEGARVLEPMCILWVTSGAATGSRGNHAFKLLRK